MQRTKTKLQKIKHQLTNNRLSTMARLLLRDEAISGKLILVATILALIAANSFLGRYYQEVWDIQLSFRLGNFIISKDLGHWISEGLMTIFFLVVGLELNRELRRGELRRLKTAALPFAAALGGMLVPAGLFIMLNPPGSDTFSGWAIPVATDIAFAIAILALIGRGIPSSIRLFLLTLAIVDDIIAVVVIAIFYTASIQLAGLLLAAIVVIMILILERTRWLSLSLFVLLAAILWLAISTSGVHASIAGAIIGLIAPLTARRPDGTSIAHRLEKFSIPVSTFLVVPLFAFANTGISFFSLDLSGNGSTRLALGIIVGLVIGKVVGVVGASFLMIRLKLADMPSGGSYRHIIGVGFLAGIGFTVSLFVTDLAFSDESAISVAKISIFIASAISGGIGFIILRNARRSDS